MLQGGGPAQSVQQEQLFSCGNKRSAGGVQCCAQQLGRRAPHRVPVLEHGSDLLVGVEEGAQLEAAGGWCFGGLGIGGQAPAAAPQLLAVAGPPALQSGGVRWMDGLSNGGPPQHCVCNRRGKGGWSG